MEHCTKTYNAALGHAMLPRSGEHEGVTPCRELGQYFRLPVPHPQINGALE
jgi:hypothetical protein